MIASVCHPRERDGEGGRKREIFIYHASIWYENLQQHVNHHHHKATITSLNVLYAARNSLMVLKRKVVYVKATVYSCSVKQLYFNLMCILGYAIYIMILISLVLIYTTITHAWLLRYRNTSDQLTRTRERML